MRGKVLKTSLTVIGAVIFSTVGIFASDGIRGINHSITNIAGVGQTSTCKVGMVPLKHNGSILCVDRYEASAAQRCPNQNPASVLQSEQNANTADCYVASVPDAVPWSNITLPQAQRMCAGAGKRLPTNAEWYAGALGTNPSACVINADIPSKTGTQGCVSAIGAFDLVGNVWEWVDANVVGDTFDNRQLPSEGYVASVDANGIAITSDQSPQMLYGSDYFWSKTDGVFGMIRGGFYGSKDDAGLYTTNAAVPTSFATGGVGFRCVEDIL